jgi:hypothetical protein
MTDWLQNVRLHYTGVDWDDPTLTPNVLTKRFMGPCGYLRGLDQKDAASTEIEILKTAGYSQWGGSSKYKPFYQHFLTLLKLLMPRRDVTPNLADAVMMFCLALSKQRKALNFIGSQSSGKSLSLACIPTICLAISPHNSVGYVATPHDSASKSTLWGDTLSAFHEVQDSSPWLWPNARAYASRSINMDVTVPKAGFIEYRGIKEVGKYKGMKTVKTEGSDPLLLVCVDEFNEVKNHAFLTALSNLVSQQGFMTITSQNFTQEDNMGGILASPSQQFPENPNSYSQLLKDIHLVWHSYLSGITLRYNGLVSANILAKRTIYPYLFKQAELDFQLKYFGDDSPEYYSQVLSFPRTGLGDDTIIARSRVESSRWKDNEWAIASEDNKFAHLDPAFGGGDKPMLGSCNTGEVIAVTSDGRQRENLAMMWFTEPMTTLKLNLESKIDSEWLDRMHLLGVDMAHFIRGTILSAEHQLAIQAAEYCRQRGIPYANFSYDFSMRIGIVTAIRDIMGRNAVGFEYNGKPEGLWIETHKAEATEVCYDRNTELALLTADLFLQRQIRGGQHIEAAVTQLCRTRREMSGKKYRAESKKDYKARHQGHSPDERDCLMGLVGISHMRGFRPKPYVSMLLTEDIAPDLFTNKYLKATRASRLPR